MSDLLTVSDVAGVEVALLPDAEQTKRVLLQGSRTIKVIEDAFDAECAADQLKNLSSAIKDMEDARKTVKAPVLDLGRRIDAIAKEWLAEIESEKKRISRVLGDYQLAERKKREAAEYEARKAEIEAREKAEAALADGDVEAAQAAADKIVESKAMVEASHHKISGTSVREVVKFEVEDIEALFKARPDLCKIEPNTALIRETVKVTPIIPGVRVWKEAVSTAR